MAKYHYSCWSVYEPPFLTFFQVPTKVIWFGVACCNYYGLPGVFCMLVMGALKQFVTFFHVNINLFVIYLLTSAVGSFLVILYFFWFLLRWTIFIFYLDCHVYYFICSNKIRFSLKEKKKK